MALEIVGSDIYGLRCPRSEVKTVLDVGANIGVFSVYAKLRLPGARVVAVEPGKTARSFLAANVAPFDIDVLPYAIGSASGTATLSVTADLTASRVCGAQRVATPELCEMVTFDDLVSRLSGRIDFLKLDCEGAEYHILTSDSLDVVQSIRGELHTCEEGNPEIGLKQLRARGFSINMWLPFPDGNAGIVWAVRQTN